MAETSVYRDRNFQIACGATFLVMMMVAIIVPAFPTMVKALDVSEQSIGLLITLFTLPSFLFVPLAGVLAGMLHLPIIMHVGSLHGYMNLYNNGFAGGLVMLMLIGIIKGVKPELLLDEEVEAGKENKEDQPKLVCS